MTDKIFQQKYCFELEKTFDDVIRRIANYIGDTSEQQEKYYLLMQAKKFFPGGRILANAHPNCKNSLFNCYCSDIGDTIWADAEPSIYKTILDHAITFKYGGGQGVNISALRPKGEKIEKTGGESCGAVGFIDLLSINTGTIASGKNRRGALMIIMKVNHPDIYEFISIKNESIFKTLKNLKKKYKEDEKITEAIEYFQKNRRAQYCNLSVFLSDEFMKAVINDEDFQLRWANDDNYLFQNKGKIFRTIKAKHLWNEIIKSSYEGGEPGILFEDTMRRTHNTEYYKPMIATNPCSEIFGSAHFACCLGSFNLKAYVQDSKFNYDEFRNDIKTVVEFMDSVLDAGQDRHPLKEQKEENRKLRKLGIGIMGFADVCVMLKIKYDCSKAIRLLQTILETLRDEAYKASIDLAKEKGSFEVYDWEGYSKSAFIKSLPKELKDQIKQYGIRNSTLLAIAPTGTLSILAECANGIEPFFSKGLVKRKTRRQQDVDFDEYIVMSKTLEELFSDKNFPDYVVDVNDIDSAFRIKMLSVAQNFIDSGISSTINLPEKYPITKIKELYILAWKLGLKGLTIFLKGSRLEILKEV